MLARRRSKFHSRAKFVIIVLGVATFFGGGAYFVFFSPYFQIVEIEVENLTEFHEAIEARPDWIMLDNFSIADLNKAVASTHEPIKLEASGGIEKDEDLIAIAETGVDYISVGALTKHCLAIDLSMRFVERV